VSGESLVLVLFALWFVILAVVFVPAVFPEKAEERAVPLNVPGFFEPFVEAVARGDFAVAEQAAASVFPSARPMTPTGGDQVLDLTQ
jgi:hypothetical protein